ncbi:MAG TPA: hypothetical protein PLV68_11780, partial [Ilumatobacteraceae bacterium]|nr:hypothetical protein [Ilumatobacteraceae bacterium]
LGLSDVGCAGVNGDGYISFDYDPALLDEPVGGNGSLTVVIATGDTATMELSGTQLSDTEQPVETTAGRWTVTVPAQSCVRLTIDLVSANGSGSATYGVDLRRGGEAVECDQRDLPPEEAPELDPDAPP